MARGKEWTDKRQTVLVTFCLSATLCVGFLKSVALGKESNE